MKKSIISKTLLSIPFIFAALVFSSCGSVRSAKSLYNEAKQTFGKCTIVSQNSTKERTAVVLHDELQDFDYEMFSSMYDISIDGSSFGSVPSDSNTFRFSLIEKLINNNSDRLEEICINNNAEYSVDELIRITAPDKEAAMQASLGFAEIFQRENLKSRLDGLMISADSEKDDIHYGSVVLPEITWTPPEEELVTYFIDIAHKQTDKEAVFLRYEKRKFKDTEADIFRVVSVLGTDYPESPDDEVTIYYFKSSSGNEYYICDFNYYDDNGGYMNYYSNYSE